MTNTSGKSADRSAIVGVLAPNITFFGEDGSVDLGATERHMRWMLTNGINGLFVTGSYGCGPLMTIGERSEVFRLAKSVAADFADAYVIAHVGCADTASSIELARVADQIGVDAVSAVPPTYYTYPNDRVVDYYAAIVEATSLPVFAYNNPVTTKTKMSLKLIQKLQEVGLKGVKDSSMDVKFLSSVYYDAKNNGKDFKTIIGTSTGWLPFYYMGINTMIAGMSNYAPEIISALYRATIAGDVALSEKLYALVIDYSDKLKFINSTVVSHMVLKARGLEYGDTRRPMSLPASDHPKYAELAEDSARALDRLQALEGGNA